MDSHALEAATAAFSATSLAYNKSIEKGIAKITNDKTKPVLDFIDNLFLGF
jgi:hypothetical protein